jgi:hypothetical protein
MKSTLLSVVVVVGGVLSASTLLGAHHGAATFDTATELTLKGTVTEWLWFNPHCFLKFDVKDESGAVRSWAAETQNPTSMSTRGWGRTSFKPGDAVTVTVLPSKTGAPVGVIKSVVLADGRTLTAIGEAPAAQPQPSR